MTKPTMDELRLAQLLSQDISDQKKLEFLEDLDVTCTIPGKSSAFQERTAYLGCNCLHIAVIVINEHRHTRFAEEPDLDLTFIQKLLDLGANLLQQDIRYGETPLHEAADYVKNYSGISVWELVGVLQEHRLVNTLLSAQVKSDNPFNAKCKSGISHLHIACMFNHAKAVMFFARFKDSVNQVISVHSYRLSGYTPLHCAIRYSSSESAFTLLTLGADIYLENAEGFSSVCYLLQRLLDMNDYYRMTNDSPSYPYEKEIERLDSIVKVIVLKYRSDDSQLVENTGLSAFHLACMLKDNWIMQSYIKWDFGENINKPVTCTSKCWSGWTPLHFAACCNIQSFEMLLQNNADMSLKNAKGETALNFCLRRYSPEITLSHLSMNTVLSDKTTKLTALMSAISKYNTCKEFLQKLKDINLTVPLEFPFWSGYNLLHTAISMNHKSKFAFIFHRETDYCSKISYAVSLPSTPGDGYLYWPRIEIPLRRGCSVHFKNADGLTPIHLALELNEWYVAEELLAHAHENVVGPSNLSFLHIACALGKKDVVERLLEKGADVNSPVMHNFEWPEEPNSLSHINKNRVLIRTTSTPLHIAVIFKNEEVVEKLLDKHADIHAEDELGFTPLHLSLCSTKSIAQLLLSEVSNLRDVKTEDGLSYLHVAAFFDDEKAVEKLLRDGADVNGFITDTVPGCLADFVGKTPFHLAIEGQKVTRILLENGANILTENPYCSYATPLDLSMRKLDSLEFKLPFEKLKSVARIDALTTSSITTLHVACATLDLDWTRNLLKQGANPNAQMKDDTGQANTPMHLVIKNANWSRTTSGNFRLFMELLVEYGADATINSNCKTSLHLISDAYFEKRWFNPGCDKATLLAIADLLLFNQRTYAFNPVDVDGFSHFHVACMTNNVTVMKMYLNNGIDINHSTSPFANRNAGYTPLHFAIMNQKLNAVSLLMQRGADVKVINTDGNTPLHLAIKTGFINYQLFDALLKKGADTNAKNLKDESPIMCLLSHRSIFFTHELFQFFVFRGSLIDITQGIYDGQGIIGFAMENTKSSDVELVFNTLIELASVKDAMNKGFLAIHNVVSVRGSRNLTREHYLNAMQKLAEKGSDIDEQDEDGKRALDVAISFHNINAIKALLLLGANVNVIEDEDECSSVARSCRSSTWDKKSIPFMRNHLWKMALFKLDLNVSNQKALKEEEFQPDVNTMKLYQSELEMTKHTKMGQSFTADNFLSEWGAVVEYPNMSVAERQAVDNFFNRTNNLHKEFPEFAGILTMQYRKALARVKLMQPVKDILVAARIDLPDLCLEAILKYLKNTELIFLIENVDEVPRPCKRRKMQQVNPCDS